MKRVAFYTLGCKLNFSETSTIARQFKEKGYVSVDFHDKPDIYIINTCSVTENADKKCKKIVREAKKISPHAFVAIIGCYAQLKPKEIASIEGVDAVLGAAEKFRLIELIDDFKKPKETKVYSSPIEEVKLDFKHAYSIDERTRTFLKVQDGCNYNCSFCTIPLARGKSRSDTVENIIASVKKIAQTEIKEVVLTGVNIGDFGIVDGKRKEKFIDLIRALDEVEGIDRFRISSIEPNLLSDEIIAFVARSKRFVPHFHIPLQSGSNRILQLMRRRYERERYEERITKIKSLMPHCCIGVDVIVGFPDEREEDFLETYHFLNRLDISYLHVFTYSERSDTAALSIHNSIPQSIRKERSHMLRILSEKKKRYFYEQNIGRKAIVLFEEKEEHGVMYGFTENYIKIASPYESNKVNHLFSVDLKQLNKEGHMEADIYENKYVY